MSRPIKLTEEHKDLVDEMVEKIWKTKMLSSEFKFTAKMPDFERNAVILFTPEAYGKMLSLIMSFESEVGWYCTCDRHGDLDDDVYVIDDVLVFPQEVNGVNVKSRDEERMEWFESLPDDVLKGIRCDCHSHVNMGTTPSGTDIADMNKVLENLRSDAFRIFMIWNKKLDFTCRIYDMAKNVCFDTKDVSVDVLGVRMGDFLAGAKEVVKPIASATKYSGKKQSSSAKSNQSNIVEEDDEEDWLNHYAYGYPAKRGKGYDPYYGW